LGVLYPNRCTDGGEIWHAKFHPIGAICRPCGRKTSKSASEYKIKYRHFALRAMLPVKIAICAPSHNFVELSFFMSAQLRHISTIGKSLLNSNISYTCPYTMVNFGPVAAEIGWRVWGTPANFNGFRVFYSLLQRRRSMEANQTYDVGPSSGLVHYTYIFGGFCPLTEFCQVQNSLCVQVLRSPILAALLHGTRAAGVG